MFRTFCEPGKDNIIICPPTYPMYEVNANINCIEIKSAPLLPDYQLNVAHIEQLVNEHTKIIWICSPNNPTGNSLDRIDIETILNHFNGLVVVDEAYINFSKQKSFSASLIDYPNLVVLQTLSKAWGLAGLRLGMCFASEAIIGYMNKVKAPYNINIVTQELALQALDARGRGEMVPNAGLRSERPRNHAVGCSGGDVSGHSIQAGQVHPGQDRP